ncbi:MAG: sulfur carrier protein ThiS [Myxococcota bacterium]
MDVFINGEKKTLDGPLTVGALLGALGLSVERVAVEVNRQVIPRARHDEHRLQEGDQVELVTFVGGG